MGHLVLTDRLFLFRVDSAAKTALDWQASLALTVNMGAAEISSIKDKRAG